MVLVIIYTCIRRNPRRAQATLAAALGGLPLRLLRARQRSALLGALPLANPDPKMRQWLQLAAATRRDVRRPAPQA
jgi:hypothetical protein